MKPSTVAVAIGLGLLAFFGVVFLSQRPPAGRTETPPIRAEENLPMGEGAAVPVRSEGGAVVEPAPTTADSSREQVSTAAARILRGRVRSEGGEGIDEALVALSVLTSRDLAWEPAWARGEWGELDTPRVSTRSSEDGRFEIDLGSFEGEAERGVLFVRRAGYLGALEEVSISEPEFTEIVLEEEAPFEIQVVDSDGVPVEGAKVVRFGVVPDGGSVARATDEELRARYARDEGRTDAAGLLEFGAYSGEVVLVASTEDRISLPWRGQGKGRALLQLMDAFELEGRVRLPDWSDLNYEGERRLRVTAKTGGLDRQLAVVRHVEAGPYGPLRLPRLEATDYTVHLEGSPIIPIRETFRPEPGVNEVRVDLNAERGANVWFQLVDMEDNLIPEGEATLSWEWEGRRNQLTRHTDSEGYLNLWSVPPVRFDVVARAPGYATSRYAGHSADQGLIQLHMPRAGVIRGRCLADGEPVRDFTVMAYQTDLPAGDTVQFEGREDGSFELTTAPAAKVLVSASSADSPPCAPVALDLEEGEPATVVLELGAGEGLSGIVVDGESGEPLSHVAVQQVAEVGATGAQRWGSLVYTDELGEFSIDSVGAGAVRLEVSREGYAPKQVAVGDRRGSEATPIRIQLNRPSELVVNFEGLPAHNYAELVVSASTGSRTLPAATPDPDGTLRLSGIGPGLYRLTVFGAPLRGATYFRDVIVHARQSLSVPFRVGGPNHLSVSFDRKRLAPDATALFAGVHYLGGPGDKTYLSGQLDDAGSFEAWGISAPRVQVVVSTIDGDVLGARTASFQNGELQLELDGEQRAFELRVLDERGEPVAGVDIYQVDAETGARGASERTGPQGQAALVGLPESVVSLLLIQEEVGFALVTGVDAREPRADVVFRPIGSLSLTITNHGAPVAGVESDLYFGPMRIPGFFRESGGDGRVAWEHLAPGRFEVSLTRPGYWAERVPVAVGASGTSAAVELRRLGDVRVVLRNADGVPVAGVGLELVDEGTGERVADWVAAGRVESSGVTDGSGAVLVRGLPEGSYRVSVAGGVELGRAACAGGVETETALVLSPR